MNILLYGAGQRLFYELAGTDYYFRCMKQDGVNIVGILDSNSEKIGKEIVLNQIKYTINKKEERKSMTFNIWSLRLKLMKK